MSSVSGREGYSNGLRKSGFFFVFLGRVTFFLLGWTPFVLWFYTRQKINRKIRENGICSFRPLAYKGSWAPWVPFIYIPQHE